MGFINADSQDEGIYLNYIHEILEENFNFYGYKNLPENYLANPVETFKFRSMLLYPVALFFQIFGISDFTATLYPLLTSLGSIVLIFYLGRLLFNEKVGLLAAFLLSFFPLNVMFATRIMPDLPLAFFSMLTIYFFLKAEKSKKGHKILNLREDRVYYLFSGLSFGLGYLVKPMIFSLIPFLFIYILYKKKVKFELTLIVLGFIIILIIEGFYYYTQSGNFFLNLWIARSQYMQKYTIEPFRTLEIIPKILSLSYVDSEPIYYSRLVLNLFHHRANVNYFGFFYFFLVISVLYLLAKKEKKSYFLILLVVILFLFLELAPVGFRINREGFLIDYLLIFKRPRFLTIITIPVLLILSAFLIDIRKEITIVILIFLLFTSIYYIKESRNYLLSGMLAIREASSFLKNQPKKIVYTDYIGVGMFQYYLNYQWDDYIRSFPENAIDIKDAYVIDGGSRGADIYWEVIEEQRPNYLLNPQKGWEVIKIIHNPMKEFDSKNRDLIIYYVFNNTT